MDWQKAHDENYCHSYIECPICQYRQGYNDAIQSIACQ